MEWLERERGNLEEFAICWKTWIGLQATFFTKYGPELLLFDTRPVINAKNEMKDFILAKLTPMKKVPQTQTTSRSAPSGTSLLWDKPAARVNRCIM
jgi:hypothetical protein